MAPRKVAPFPLEIVAFHPGVLALTAAGYGILFRLLTHWWMTDLRPLPENENELYTIGRAQKAVWVAHKPDIMHILKELEPALKARRDRWAGAKLGLARLARYKAANRKREAESKNESAPDIALLAAVSKQKQGNRAVEAREQHARKRAASGFQD